MELKDKNLILSPLLLKKGIEMPGTNETAIKRILNKRIINNISTFLFFINLIKIREC
jgi:hypothetical protein